MFFQLSCLAVRPDGGVTSLGGKRPSEAGSDNGNKRFERVENRGGPRRTWAEGSWVSDALETPVFRVAQVEKRSEKTI